MVMTGERQNHPDPAGGADRWHQGGAAKGGAEHRGGATPNGTGVVPSTSTTLVPGHQGGARSNGTGVVPSPQGGAASNGTGVVPQGGAPGVVPSTGGAPSNGTTPVPQGGAARTVLIVIVLVGGLGIVAGAGWESFYSFERLATFFGWPKSHAWTVMPLVELFLVLGSAELALRIMEGGKLAGPRIMAYSALVASLAVNITYHVLTLLYLAGETGVLPKGAPMIEGVRWWQAVILGLFSALVPIAQLAAVHTLTSRLQRLATARQQRRQGLGPAAAAPAGPSLFGLTKQIAAGYLANHVPAPAPPAPAPATPPAPAPVVPDAPAPAPSTGVVPDAAAAFEVVPIGRPQGGAPASGTGVVPEHQGGAERFGTGVVPSPAERHQGGADRPGTGVVPSAPGGAPAAGTGVVPEHQGGADDTGTGVVPSSGAPAAMGGAIDEHRGGADRLVPNRTRFVPGAPVPTTALPVPLAKILAAPAGGPPATPPAPAVDEPPAADADPEPAPVDEAPPAPEAPVDEAPVDPEPPADDAGDGTVAIARGAEGFRQTLAKIAASEIAADATSWADFLAQLADETNTRVTARGLEKALQFSRKKITNALRHTDLYPWPAPADDRKEATA